MIKRVLAVLFAKKLTIQLGVGGGMFAPFLKLEKAVVDGSKSKKKSKTLAIVMVWAKIAQRFFDCRFIPRFFPVHQPVRVSR